LSRKLDCNSSLFDDSEIPNFRGIPEGLNSKAIGEQLFISQHIVDTYRLTTLEKIGCNNLAELIKYDSKMRPVLN